MPILRKVNKDFFKSWSSDMAYVLGFFAADGYMTLNRRGANYWCIQITDRELLEDIKSKIGSDHAISIRLGTGNESNLYRIQIGSREMCDDLRNLGFSQVKTKSLAVPNVPAAYFRDFVRGYFDGDGNVWSGYIHKERQKSSINIRCTFTSCSGMFLAELYRRLRIFGLIKGAVKKGKSNYYRLIYSVRS